MVYDELLQTDAVSVISEIKSTVWSLNALLQTEQNLLDPGPLLEKKVFPVKDADGTRRSAFATTDFAIGDREYLIAQFADKIKILDYTVEEVRRLRPFFEWANLTPHSCQMPCKEVRRSLEECDHPSQIPNVT